ncbi:MAG: hypothetical protein EPN47_17345 [Acidobacteria bacterium]|nr:MAG: hypothetical protein EPN47_17345 [Acidobacteriota bacterium]
MAHNDDLAAYAVLGFGFGLYTFYKGFRQYRKYLLVADTPEIPIRSAPMGFVQVYGKAQGDKTIPSPVSHAPCFAYKVVIERWKTDSHGQGGHWSHHRTDLDSVGFYLSDATGKVLVNARGAELDLPQSTRCEAGWGRSAATSVAATQEELLQYVTQADANWAGGLFEHGLKAVGPLQDSRKEQTRQGLMEAFQHAPGSTDFLTGMVTMMAPRVKQHLESIGPQSDPEHEAARQNALQAFQYPPGSPEFMEGLRRAGLTATKPGETNPFDALTKALGGAGGRNSSPFSAASGRYRFTEYCVVPEGMYDVSGTCVENPNPKDANDHNMIVKGALEKEFFISSKTEKQVESTLRKRAFLMVLGGAALSVVCLAILLGKLGLL